MNNYELYARTLAKIEALEEELAEATSHLNLSWNACTATANAMIIIDRNFRSQIIGTSYSLKKICKSAEEGQKLIDEEMNLEE